MKKGEEKEIRKCYFCGVNQARTQAGLNDVKYRIIHPNLSMVLTILYRFFHHNPWVYCCKDCFSHMREMWGYFKYEEIGASETSENEIEKEKENKQFEKLYELVKTLSEIIDRVKVKNEQG